jgi:type I restriction enzyme S subunit
MDTKALRQKILDLAIRGKLVPQDPNDEPASVLLERIRAEKQQMVKDGKLKPKDIKNDTVIFKDDDNLHYEKFSGGTVKCIEDEIPFDVPNNWEWCRFGSYTLNRDSERKPVSSVQRKKVKKIYDYYGASGVIDQTDSFLFDEELLLIGEDGANLLARTKPIAFLADGKYWVNNHAHCIDSIDKRLLKFICIYINAINLFQYITGSAQPKLNQDNMNKILIPIPPKAEQEKILESIKIILSNINDIDLLKGKLQSNIANAKSKILDLAIRGKLVPQNPNDEPASVLLERIRAEKEELIKQGKIKRDKKESVIFKGDDNSYYEKYGEKLPSGWVVTNFETLLSYEQPTNYIVKDTNYNSDYETPVLTAGKSFILGYTDEKENVFSKLPVIIFDDFTTESKFVDFPFKVKSSAMKILHINTDIVLPKFAFYLMQATEIDHDNHQRYWISTYSQEEIALPPLKEQERILSVLEQYFKLLNCLL